MLLNRDAIVKFKSPTNERLLKRIVAVPGDELEFKGRQLYVNGKLIDDWNNVNGVRQATLAHKQRKHFDDFNYKLKLKDGEYYVMGDNRHYSVDSRDFGPINKSCILAVVDAH